RGDPVRKSSAVDLQQLARLVVRASFADRFKIGVPIGFVDRSARKDVRPADEVTVEVAPQHEDLERSLSVVSVTHKHHGRRVADLHLRRGTVSHPSNRPRRYTTTSAR